MENTTINETEYLSTFKSEIRNVKFDYLMTPEMARYIILNHNVGNRKILDKHVRKFEKDIELNRFQQFDFITFDTNGNLSDGQHRVTAISRSKQPVYVNLSLGVSPEYRGTANICRKQSIGDDIEMNRQKKNKTSALKAPELRKFYSATKLIFALQSTNSTIGKEELDNYELNTFIEDNWDTVFSRIYGAEQKRNVVKPSYMYNPALMYAVEYLLWKKETDENKEKVHQFFDDLWTARNATVPNTVICAYAELIESLKNRTGAAGYTNVIRCVYSAWVAYKGNETPSQINVVPKSEVPDFRK